MMAFFVLVKLRPSTNDAAHNEGYQRHYGLFAKSGCGDPGEVDREINQQARQVKTPQGRDAETNQLLDGGKDHSGHPQQPPDRQNK